MFKRILVPLDGSALAEQALPVVARLARASGSVISLVRVISTEPASLPSAPGKPLLIQTISEADRTMAENYLAGIATSDVLKNLTVKTDVAIGLVAPTILSLAAAHFADLIVLSSHGFTGVSRWVLGSIAEKITRYSPIPVLILREGGSVPIAKYSDQGEDLHVLVPLDGSQYAESAIGPAITLAAALSDSGQGKIHLLHVTQQTRSTGTSSKKGEELSNEQANVSMVKTYLDMVNSRIQQQAFTRDTAERLPKMSCSIRADNDVAHRIVLQAEQENDVIVLSTHGSGGVEQWGTGTIAGRILHTTRQPVLVVRPPHE